MRQARSITVLVTGIGRSEQGTEASIIWLKMASTWWKTLADEQSSKRDAPKRRV